MIEKLGDETALDDVGDGGREKAAHHGVDGHDDAVDEVDGERFNVGDERSQLAALLVLGR